MCIVLILEIVLVRPYYFVITLLDTIFRVQFLSMTKKFLFFFIVFTLGFSIESLTQDAKKDTVHVGIYITSIHDIDFKQKEFAITFLALTQIQE